MKLFLSLTAFFVFLSYGMAQNESRIEISGKVIVDSNDVEGLTVTNITSNRIAVTDFEGEFSINVTLNDKIKISALQYNSILIIVTKEILKSKQLTVFLDEHVTALDEVVILPFTLTGDLETDLTKVRTFNPKFETIYFGDALSDENQYTDIQYQEVENTILRQGRFYNGVDLVKITNWLVKPLFGLGSVSKNTNNKNSNYAVLRDAYTKDFISTNFNIPEDQVSDFIAFAEANNTDMSLYEKGKDIELIQYLVEQSKLYLKTQIDKN
ncbi:MAG TPA: hypothetical protein VKY34_00865 [Xanthomarina sp.]|nr:hypothetical protein [Xanthomarina sp.]